jgi:hypothetical protein
VDKNKLIVALSSTLTPILAQELVSHFLSLKVDFVTSNLERSSCGKFVECFVQCLQFIGKGAFEKEPSVDAYLSQGVLNETIIPDGLRICGARVARSMYTLRNKRSIAHKNEVDPNTFDLALLYQCASWIMAEMLRFSTGGTMQSSGELIRMLIVPTTPLVEDLGGTRIVHAETTVEGELLLLLHSHYPTRVSSSSISASLISRNAGSVRATLSKLKHRKTVYGDAQSGFTLTRAGYDSAQALVSSILS